uniref:Protein kinase domain-containing protein n=1 Tax=Rhizophagus irregularis (strain DAOM 181602 / DAOM 197198 / MUCL 43194) TaxID=747089 RepID=U9UZ74_RHIID
MSNLCEECGNEYTDKIWKWCKPCQINSLKNYTTISDNEKINNFIQKMRSKIDSFSDILFEWIPYDQFNNINKINDFANAIWTDGRLGFSFFQIKYIRAKNIKVSLKFSQYNIDEFLNEANEYSIKFHQFGIRKIYGISQNPNTKEYIMVLEKEKYCERCDNLYTNGCKSCQINLLKENFTNWTSGNEKIDNFIQGMQSEINDYKDIIFEWIPYNQFDDINEILVENDLTIYLAKWKDGPLYYHSDKKEYIRLKNKKVSLKCFQNLQDKAGEFLNKVNLQDDEDNQDIFGISQNPNTNDYIIVLQNGYCEKCNQKYTNANYNWCKSCQKNSLKENFTNWTNENEKINSFIQEMQLRIESPLDIIFEWVSYNQFNDIKEINEDGFTKAIWSDGPLNYDKDKSVYRRSQSSQNKEVALKYLYNLQNITNEILNEIGKTYSIKNQDNNIRNIYGISQNPNTKEYIIILQYANCEKCIKKEEWCKFCEINYLKENFANWTSGNRMIDNFIQEMQLKIDNPLEIVFEWIPYDQFIDIEEILSINDNFTMYSSKWKNNMLIYLKGENKYKRLQSNQNRQIILKGLHNSKDIINDFLNEAKKYSIKINDNMRNIYGITQSPKTKEYFMVLQKGLFCEKCYINIIDKWCKLCQINFLKENFTNWTSGNEKIDNFIQEMQLKINYQTDIVTEWIPYDQFNNIKEIVINNLASVYSAIWKEGQLDYDESKNEYIRNQNKGVILKCLHNFQNITDEFLNKIIKTYSIKKQNNIRNIYGITQSPDTKDYIMVLETNSEYCEKCDKKYKYIFAKWCESCEINCLRENFTNWTSGNKEIDNFIQKMQLKINYQTDIVAEWIPYNQFDNIKEINKNGVAEAIKNNSIHSAIWKDGPLDYDKYKYTRSKNEKVTLKCLHNSQNITDEFLNEV